MRVFIDSSALAKLYIEEAGSAETETTLRGATVLGVSALCVPEVVSAMNRRRREARLAKGQYGSAKDRFLDDMGDADVLPLSSSIVDRSIAILERNALRASDAVHIASALDWRCDLFVSGDARQIAAAGKAGLKTRKV
ncbi:MAG: type II toxin-antitoxin system VapC family toxin [Candidatus Sumerlaeota bacterium]|nr:type II toxin-antitoxin system VapC family toxin [Candidatus Sumerlaeota bacterium]